MTLRLVFSALLLTSVRAHLSRLEYRATPQAYRNCINPNDVALTFDDGPYNYLRSISDQFTAAGAKATFFMNGNNFDCIYKPQHVADLKYAYAAGHMMASHSWSHPHLPELSTMQVQDNLFRLEEAFSRILGIKPAFMRPPYGEYNSNVQSISAARGQNLALWDWDTGDASGNTTDQSKALYDHVGYATPRLSNAIILHHEVKEHTATILVPYAISLFQSRGYNLVTVAECLGVEPYEAIGLPQEESAHQLPALDVAAPSNAKTGTPVFSTTTAPPGPTATPTPNQYIHPTANSAKCLTAASNSDGAAVQISDCVSAGSASQSWTILGSALQIFGNKCLDVNGGSTASGTKMQIWTCGTGNANQQWSLSGSAIQWSGRSSCLDLSGGRLTNGNVMQIWTCNGGTNQKWTRTTGPGTTTPPPPPPTTGNKIKPDSSSATCLTAPSNTNGAKVVVQPCNGSAGQSWTKNGQTMIVYGSMCLDVIDGSTANGAKMQIWSCTPGSGNANQRFTVTAGRNIQWVNKGKCLDLSDGSLASGNQVQMWGCSSGNANQVWNIV
ncbi:hypothetical protein B0H15DRAFT_949292 [Mycena belliarum]|uniref:NodB homology domain-containing protein n=1 Tax=Mycena belliarum TaxID=1033014 RepID=A0AAD6U907_9AGAR|nr:hypothetical protein B0H15DRAFT_949292 [Mycena belliae]